MTPPLVYLLRDGEEDLCGGDERSATELLPDHRDALSRAKLVQLASLAISDRPRLLTMLKHLGVASLGQRQAAVGRLVQRQLGPS